MGIGNQLYGYQMADLESQVYYQAKDKNINDREKMKNCSICHPWGGDIVVETN